MELGELYKNIPIPLFLEDVLLVTICPLPYDTVIPAPPALVTVFPITLLPVVPSATTIIPPYLALSTMLSITSTIDWLETFIAGKFKYECQFLTTLSEITPFGY